MNKKLPIRKYQLDEEGMMGVYAVSLVEEPAIMVDWVALAEQKQIKMSAIDEERRMLYGPLLIPDQLIYRVDPETQEEYYAQYSGDVIMQCAHLFLKKNQHHNATLMHQVPLLGCTVVESWVKEFESDKSVGLGMDLPIKTWFIGQHIDNDATWAEVKNGTVKGHSIEAFFIQDTAMSRMIADFNKLVEEIEKVS